MRYVVFDEKDKTNARGHFLLKVISVLVREGETDEN